MLHGARSLCLIPMILFLGSCAAPLTPLTRLDAEGGRTGSRSSGPWLQYVDVRQAGFDPQALRAVCERADVLRSGALMVVFKGHVLLACGDVSRKFEAHSLRKSLVSGLYGTAVARHEIDLDSTLADFAIDEPTPLTALERSATLRHVISARSGVYLPAAYGASQEKGRPIRGSHPPGTHWFYNNWDFNVAGVVYEQATGEDLYESFERRVAKPLGMEDWDRADGFRVYEPTKSRYPAHTFRISTRDLARFGQLYLQAGRWADRQILPASWVAESTRPHTDDGDGTGYGYMWWTYREGPFTARYQALGRNTFYRGLGTGEQGLWVIRSEEVVVVQRADTDHGRSIDSQDHWELVESILAARRSEPEPSPGLGPLQPAPFLSQLPPVTIPQYRPLRASLVDDYLGDYKLGPGPAQLGPFRMTSSGTVRVFLFDEKPYMHLPGVGDVQMFPDARDTFTVRIVRGFEIFFTRGAGDDATGVTLTLGGHTIEASRLQRPARSVG